MFALQAKKLIFFLNENIFVEHCKECKEKINLPKQKKSLKKPFFLKKKKWEEKLLGQNKKKKFVSLLVLLFKDISS